MSSIFIQDILYIDYYNKKECFMIGKISLKFLYKSRFLKKAKIWQKFLTISLNFILIFITLRVIMILVIS